MRKLAVAVVAFALMVSSIYWIWTGMRESFYTSRIPSKIEIDEILTSADGDHCGHAVMHISPSSALSIATGGVAYLSDAVARRDRPGATTYFNWVETPASITTFGLECANLDEEVRRKVIAGLSGPGSYATTSRGAKFQFMIVLPKLGLLVHTW
jgi:hypothetical protein